MNDIKQELLAAHALARKLMGDKSRPKYHFCVPFDLGFPADPNAMFYAGGRYHLMFIYDSREDSYRWGHASSADLLHWTFHPDVLTPDETDGGIYSGGVYLDEAGKATVAYWALGRDGSAGGIRIAESCGPLYEVWHKREGYIVASTEHGITEIAGKPVACADPSNIYRAGGKYCMQLGNLCLLNKFRGDEAHPEFQGDWSELFLSDDMVHWTYDGRFYERLKTGGTELSEDCMCPYFCELPTKNGKKSGVYLLLFISHNRGCQYYLGDFNEKTLRFIPKKHGRLTIADNALFAPEAVDCPDGRLAVLSWMRDNLDDNLERELAKGWSGVYCLPRELCLGEDGDLCVRYWREIERQRACPEKFSVCGEKKLNVSLNSEVVLQVPTHGKTGVRMKGTDGEVLCYVDADRMELVFDSTGSGAGRKVIERVPLAKRDELHLFFDGCVVDLFSADRAISRQIFLEEGQLYAFSDETAEGCFYEIIPTNFI